MKNVGQTLKKTNLINDMENTVQHANENVTKTNSIKEIYKRNKEMSIK